MIVVNVKYRRYSFMNKIITHIAFIWLLFAPMLTLAQTKRALVIGIGRQEDSAWNKINGDKDVPYVLEILNDANYEQIITCVNEEAAKKAPTVICFDELDGMVPDRSTIHNEGASGEVNEFLSQLNNCSERGIFVIGTSNRPEKIDPAILRTGRMDKMVYIPMPDVEARKELFKIHLADRYCDESIDLDELAKQSDGYVASDICFMVNASALEAAIADVPISQELVIAEMRKARRSVTQDDAANYEHMRKKFEQQTPRQERRRIGF